jgi:predicted NUDIX family phosphoesterase
LFFTYARGRISAETRLHARLSIGLGGHISEDRESVGSVGEDLYRAAAVREVNEEVHIDSTYREHIVGVINDDSDEVGRVHFGIVHIWDLKADRSVRPREEQIEVLGFLSMNELRAQIEQLENWSRIAIEMTTDVRVPRYAYQAYSS